MLWSCNSLFRRITLGQIRCTMTTVFYRAGQCQTNPWPAAPDWTLLPECQCRSEAADYRTKCRCGTNYGIPAFTYDFSISYSKNNTIRSCLWTCRMYHFPLPAVFPFTTTNNSCNVRLSASSQSGTGMNKTSDAGTSPVPEEGDPVRYRNAPVPDWDPGCRNADAGGIDLAADAQLLVFYKGLWTWK